MIILSRIAVGFRTHIVVRGPGVRGLVWKVFCCGWTSVAPLRKSIMFTDRNQLRENPKIDAKTGRIGVSIKNQAKNRENPGVLPKFSSPFVRNFRNASLLKVSSG
jgi:hypothetical protein